MARRKTTVVGPDPIDLDAGRRIRERRLLQGLSQTELAHRIGVTFQQLQKYERGANRIAASTLVRIAEALQTTPAAFLSSTDDGGHFRPTPPTDDRVLRAAHDLARVPHRIRSEIEALIRTIVR